jgi:hypothetical protein
MLQLCSRRPHIQYIDDQSQPYISVGIPKEVYRSFNHWTLSGTGFTEDMSEKAFKDGSKTRTTQTLHKITYWKVSWVCFIYYWLIIPKRLRGAWYV